MVRFGHMEKSNEGMGIQEAVKSQEEGKNVLFLNHDAFISRLSEIESLSKNPLDVTQNLDKQGTPAVRKQELAEVAKALKEMHPSMLVMATEKDGKIVSVMIVNKKGGQATVEHMWMSVENDGQPPMIEILITSALSKLKSGSPSFDTLHIKLKRGLESQGLRHYLDNFPPSKLIVGDAAANDDQPLEKAA